MSVEQLEQSLLRLSRAERRQFARWFFQHEAEIVEPRDDDEIPADVKAEVLRRDAQLEANPDLAVPVTEQWFDELKKRLADARPRQTPAR